MTDQQQSIKAIQDIKQMMERSSRFISLSGLSGISAGFFGLAAAVIASNCITTYYHAYNDRGHWNTTAFEQLKWKLLLLAIITLAFTLLSGFYFTWQKAKKSKVNIWDASSKRLVINFGTPLIAGGIFILAMLLHNEWIFIGPACLIFYGLALINASKYTLDDIRYLGLLEIMLGCTNLFFPGYGLYFWAIGFGVLHIVYGILMWNKYERKPQA